MSDRYFEETIRHNLIDQESLDDAFIDIIQTLTASTHIIRSLMIDDTLSISSGDAEGVHKLFKQQILMLSGVYEEYADREAKRALDGKRAVADDDLSAAVRQLRHDFMRTHTSAGIDHRLIAQAIGVSIPDMERMIRQVQGDAAPRAKAARTAGAADAR